MLVGHFVDLARLVLLARFGLVWHDLLVRFGRVEICCVDHDRRSCKMCADCVIFSRKHREFLHNLRRKMTDNIAFTLFLCEQFMYFYCLKLWARKSSRVIFFDKSHVCRGPTS